MISATMLSSALTVSCMATPSLKASLALTSTWWPPLKTHEDIDSKLNQLNYLPKHPGQQQCVAALALRHLVAPLTRLQSKVNHNILHCLLQGLEGEAESVLQLIILPQLLPGGTKVPLHDPLHIVSYSYLDILQLVLVIIPSEVQTMIVL